MIALEYCNAFKDRMRRFKVERVQLAYSGGDIRVWLEEDGDPVFLNIADDEFVYDDEPYTDLFIEPIEETPDVPYEEFIIEKGGLV